MARLASSLILLGFVMSLGSCGGQDTITEKGILELEVICAHRDEVASNLPDNARDWSTTRNILVELTPVSDQVFPEPQIFDVTLSSDGISPQFSVGRPEDKIRLINASHRPLHITSVGELDFKLTINHGESRTLDLGHLETQDRIFDMVGERVLVVKRTTAPVARYINSHKKIHIVNLKPGRWNLRLSHEEIPVMNLTVEVREDGITRISPRFTVGRLPLIR